MFEPDAYQFSQGYQPPRVEPLEAEAADAELLASVLPDTELVSPKPGLKVVVIANVVVICGVAVRLRLGVVVRLRLGVAVKVLVKFLIKSKFLLNDFIAGTILFVCPKTGYIPSKALLKLVPLPIFITPCIIMKLCVQFSIELHSRHSDFIYHNANNKIFPFGMVCYI